MEFLIIGIIIFIGILVICSYLQRTKCPNCNSRKVCETNRTKLNSEQKLFKEIVRIKEYDNKYNSRSDLGHRVASNQYLNPPSKIITQEVVVEGKRTWYKVQYKCTKCNNEFSVKEYIDKKPQID